MAKGKVEYDLDAGREYSGQGQFSRPNGRTIAKLICPFCKALFEAFVWSLCGGGKKCPGCGAIHYGRGMAYPVREAAHG